MRKLIRHSVYLCVALMVIATLSIPALCLESIELPKPQLESGKPLMQALAARKTTREFSDQALSPQMLSNLLWAAFGMNREQADRPGIGRTAPSAMNRQEIDLYVVLSSGVYVYQAKPHTLKPIVEGDIRAKTGSPEAAQAAVNIIFVTREKGTSAEVDTGFIGQNIYLFAASERLNAWFRTIRGEELAKALQLDPEQRILYAQTVGYPVNK